jgi:hypothetical protein
MQVDVVHWNDLCAAAACGAALHAEAGAERRFAQAEKGLLLQPAQRISEADGRRGLAFTCRCRIDRRHQDELAILLLFQAGQIVAADLCLVVAEGDEILRANSQTLTDLSDRQFLRTPRNRDVAGHGPPLSVP